MTDDEKAELALQLFLSMKHDLSTVALARNISTTDGLDIVALIALNAIALHEFLDKMARVEAAPFN